MAVNITVELNRKEIWSEAFKHLEETAPSSLMPWIAPLEIVLPGEEQYKEDIFTLKSGMSFGVAHLNQTYLKDIQKAVSDAAGRDINVEIIFVPSENKKRKKESKTQILKEVQLENLKQMQSFSSLNLKYTFENFVEGENSKVALNAAKIIAQNPGVKYNPFFITGSVGIGKTHLMQAIGHEIMKKHPGLKIKYAKTEEFTNHLIDSCRNGCDGNDTMKRFRDKYRNIDVLLLDDVQFAEGKKRTEEEIFNTYETLFHLGKQIVFASDKPVDTFEKTPDRLKSRYLSGLCVEITPPSMDTRVEIIKKYAKYSNFEIEDDVANFLAKYYSKSVRELEGAYNKVSAYASIQGEKLTVDFAKKILGFNRVKKIITPESIIKKSGEYFNLSPETIIGKDRSKDVMIARQISMYLVKEILDLSYPQIGKAFNRNHTTAMYSYDSIVKSIQTDTNLKNKISELKNLITD